MTAKTILEEIKPLGNLSYKKVLFNHGVAEPCFGVKVEHLKKIQKRIKKDYHLVTGRRASPVRGAAASIEPGV